MGAGRNPIHLVELADVSICIRLAGTREPRAELRGTGKPAASAIVSVSPPDRTAAVLALMATSGQPVPG